MEGADFDPLGVDRGHGGFEVAELLLLFGVKPALPTGLWWRFVVPTASFAESNLSDVPPSLLLRCPPRHRTALQKTLAM